MVWRPLLVALVVASTVYGQGRRPTKRDIVGAINRAKQLRRNRQYADALPWNEKAYRWSHQIYGAGHDITGSTAFELAQAHMSLDHLGQVEPLFQEALGIFRARRNWDAVGTVLNSLGSYYSRVGQIAEAERAWGECVKIFQARRHALGVSTVRYNLASMYRQVGLNLRGYAQRAADAEKRKKLDADARSWFSKSRQALEEEIAFVSRLRLRPNDYRPHNREMVLGEVFLDLGEFERADGLFQRAKSFSDRTSGRDTHGRDLLNLGLSRCALGRYDEALSLFLRASKAAKVGLGRRTVVYATTFALQARALGHLGRFKDAARAMDECQRIERQYALEVFPSLSYTEQLSYVFRPGYLEGRNLDLAAALGAAGGPGLAAPSAEWIVNGKAMVQELLAERPRDASLAEAHARIATLVTILNHAQPKTDEHARAVRELSQWIQHEAKLSKRLGRAAGRARRPDWISLDSVRAAIPKDGVLVELARFQAPVFGGKGAGAIDGSPRYAAWIVPAAGAGDVEVVDLGPARPVEAAVQALRTGLADDVTAIRKAVIAKANAELAAYAKANGLKPGDAAFQKKRSELTAGLQEEMAKAFVARRADLLAAYRRRVDACARLVLHPLAPRLLDRSRVVLSPDAHLWLVPWCALPLPDGPLLLEKATVSYVVTGRDLLASPGGAEARAPVVLGDVNYDAGVGSPGERVEHPAKKLFWSPIEIKGIAPHLKAYAGADPVLLTGGGATEDRLKAVRNPKVLFFSTHGVFGSVDETTFHPGRHGLLYENPMLRCQLSLAGCNLRPRPGSKREDGRLYGIEIEGLDLRGTELVVLSACQTALGDVHAGQGAAGLRQAFQLAGARSVMATLWSVDDEATTRLTIELFKRLGAGRPPADALREAQLALYRADKTAHPFFWAAFTITG